MVNIKKIAPPWATHYVDVNGVIEFESKSYYCKVVDGKPTGKKLKPVWLRGGIQGVKIL